MRYDMHVHTKASSCSNMEYAALLKRAKLIGLDGIAITDHNTIKGALEVRKLNKDSDFEVIIGEEIKTTDGGEVLGYYLKEEIRPALFVDVVNEIKKQGGIVSISHPKDIFRAHFRDILLKKAKLDAIEVWNGRYLIPSFKNAAQNVAENFGIAKLAGSDAHFLFELGKCYTEFEGDLRSAIKKRTTIPHGSSFHAGAGYICTILRRNLHLI
jgi:predicted metal-dependent phosphoesterase TrpH